MIGPERPHHGPHNFRLPEMHPSSGHLWEDAKVTGASETADFYVSRPVNLQNLFKAKPRPFPGEQHITLFGDNKPVEFVHFVEWETPEPVTVGRFQLFAGHDMPSQARAFARFTLQVWNGHFFETIFHDYPSVPYNYADPAQHLLHDQALVPVTGQRFRAEFMQHGAKVTAYQGHTTYGPRILELVAWPA